MCHSHCAVAVNVLLGHVGKQTLLQLLWVNGHSTVLSRRELQPFWTLAYTLVFLGSGPLLTRKWWRPHTHLIQSWTLPGFLNTLDLCSNQQFTMGFISCCRVNNFHGKFFKNLLKDLHVLLHLSIWPSFFFNLNSFLIYFFKKFQFSF